jgi:regulator of replication initiation timing
MQGMAKTAVATSSLDIDAIDRLEQKLKQLVTVLDRTRADYARANDENARLRAELETARGRIADAEGTGAELTALRGEREQIRGRVEDMLRQIEALNL